MPVADRFFLELELGGNALTGALLDQIDRDPDGVGEAERIGAAMALDHDAIQAKEHGAVVAPWIEALADQLQRWLDQDIAEFGEERAFEGLAQDV